LLPVLQHFGLRLGQMNIFHRHTEVDGNGPVMFSMANMVKPGTFALNSLENLPHPASVFLWQLPNRHGNMKAFEYMLATANGVKQAVDGILKDERRSVLTRQTVEHCRRASAISSCHCWPRNSRARPRHDGLRFPAR